MTILNRVWTKAEINDRLATAIRTYIATPTLQNDFEVQALRSLRDKVDEQERQNHSRSSRAA